MTSIKIRLADCIRCGQCESACLYNAIYIDEYPVIEQDQCILCKNCIQACPLGLLSVKEKNVLEDVSYPVQAKGIWVLAELYAGKAIPVTYEMLGAARHLAEIAKEEVAVIVIGDHCCGEEKSLIASGADHVCFTQSSNPVSQLENNHADILVEMVRKFNPAILLVGATHFGRGVAARAASLLHTGLTADCIRLEIDPVRKRLLQIRPAFGGNLLATIETPFRTPQMASVRPGVMQPVKPNSKRIGKITTYSIDHLIMNTEVELLAEEITSCSSSITDAPVLVAGGKGMQNKENIQLLHDLATLLGGEVAASRAAVEAGWLPYESQIGQTGKTVKPRLYIACGISGQAQHIVAMSEAETIIVINNDTNAPIFQYADYGLVGDVAEVLPKLINSLKEKS